MHCNVNCTVNCTVFKLQTPPKVMLVYVYKFMHILFCVYHLTLLTVQNRFAEKTAWVSMMHGDLLATRLE